jgi:hypothetical protein
MIRARTVEIITVFVWIFCIVKKEEKIANKNE